MLDKIKRLSYSSIKKLFENPSAWYNERILWIRDNTFHDYFVVWNGMHNIIESYNKTGNKNKKIWQSYIFKESERLKHEWELYKEFSQLDALYTNYFDWTEVRAEEAELWVTTEFCWVPFMGKLDWVHKSLGYLEDYKCVASFLNEDNEMGMKKLNEYYIQGGIYMILYHKHYWEYPKFARFTEIKKSVPNVLRCKKPTVIAMAKDSPEWNVADEKLTIPKLCEKYNLKSSGKNIIDIPYSPELVARCNQLILRWIDVIKNMKEDLLSCPFWEDDIIKTLVSKE